MGLLPNNLTLLEICIDCNGSNHELIEFGTAIGKSRDCVHKIFTSLSLSLCACMCVRVCGMYDVSHFTHRRGWKMKPYHRRFFELLKENFIIRNPITKRAL